MRNLLLVFILSVIFAPALFAQTQPLTQAEFVKSLYELQKSPAKRDVLIEQIRQRGIGFEMTEPLRSLMQSKSGDAVLARTLEEAARRRSNPAAAILPSEKEAAELLTKARSVNVAAVNEMPDFVVKQLISRAYAYAGTNNWQTMDRLTVAVGYQAGKGEDYKLLAVNGIPQTETKENESYFNSGGTVSSGEFASILESIFKPENQTKFTLFDTDTTRNRRAVVFLFEIKRDNLKRRIGSVNLTFQWAESGFKGKIWVDREDFRILRVETEATELPADFPIKAVSRFIDYDWVSIADQKYLLPSFADIRFTSRQGDIMVQSRNQIRFRNYQKYGTEVKILDDDEIVEEAPKEVKKPQ